MHVSVRAFTLVVGFVVPRSFRSLLASLSITLSLVVALGEGTAVAQDAPDLPANYKALPAAEFVTVSEAYFASGGDKAPQARELVQYAWDTYLGAPAFVATGEWQVVQKMVATFGWRRSLLVTGDTFSEQDASRAGLDAQVATLRERLNARMLQERVTTTASFAELKGLRHVMGDNGYAKGDIAKLYADWMAGNNWQSLPLDEQFELFDGLSHDTLDMHSMSIRWTGFLTAPESGSYVLGQVRQYLVGTDAVLKVWVNDALVLDSSPREGSSDDARFQSRPIELTQNTRTHFRVELTHTMQHDPYYSDGTPIAALTWKRAGSSEVALIPQGAFSPPADFDTSRTEGLKGEYYRGLVFQEGSLVATRLDAGLGFSWAWGPVACHYAAQQDELLSVARQQLLRSESLRGLATKEEKLAFLNSPGWRYAHYLSLEERAQYATLLAQETELLAQMSPYAMGKLFESLYMLPGKEHLELLAVWSDVVGQPRLEIGELPGSGVGYYETLNTEFYWLIGNFLQGPYVLDQTLLQDNHLRKSDTDCDLNMARILAFASYMSGRAASHLQLLRENANDSSLSGDARATWWLAAAFADDVVVAGPPQPFRGVEACEEASLVAVSPGVRAWAIQELTARLASIGDFDGAERVLSDRQELLTQTWSEAGISLWRKKMSNVAERYKSRTDDQERASIQAYIVELNVRLRDAIMRGDDNTARGLRSLIRAATEPISQSRNP